jgi:hypothetical protein
MGHAFFNLPLWATGLSVVILLSTYAIGGLVATRRFLLPRLRIQPEDAVFSGAMTQSVIVFYALVAALIAVSTWQRHFRIKEIVSDEAASIGALWRDLGGYPPGERDSMRGTLRGYTEYIINEAWPEQREGRIPSGGLSFMDRLQDRLFAYAPGHEGEKLLHSETLRAYNHLIEMRRLRLDAGRTAIPGLVWMVILAGALLCLTTSFFFRVEDVRYHALRVVFLGIVVGLVIFLILALDRPFRGDLAIPPEPYRLILDQMFLH